MPPGDPPGSQDPCHLMCLIIRNKNIYGLGRVFWILSKDMSEVRLDFGLCATTLLVRQKQLALNTFDISLTSQDKVYTSITSNEYQRVGTVIFFQNARRTSGSYANVWQPKNRNNGNMKKEFKQRVCILPLDTRPLKRSILLEYVSLWSEFTGWTQSPVEYRYSRAGNKVNGYLHL